MAQNPEVFKGGQVQIYKVIGHVIRSDEIDHYVAGKHPEIGESVIGWTGEETKVNIKSKVPLVELVLVPGEGFAPPKPYGASFTERYV